MVNPVLTLKCASDPPARCRWGGQSMIKFAAASLLVATALATAAPASAAQITATTSANIVKPVSLMKLQDMDFGTLLVANYTGTRSIVMSRAGCSCS
jgi:spore coat protein U-like protein